MALLDQFGQPIKRSSIAEPQTSRISVLQNAYIDSHMEGITPASAGRILRDADLGDITAQHQLFDDMLDRDAHLACEFGKRSGALLGVDWSIEPPGDASAAERRDAQWVEALLRDALDDLDDVIAALMEGVGHGFTGVELAWQRRSDEWLPAFHPRPQTWFQLSQDRRELRLKNGTGEGEALIPFGWIMHQHGKAKTGYLGRIGLCRALIWPFIYKHYAVGDFAEFLETYGLPIILGKYYQGASPAEKTSLMRAVTMLGHDARAIMPKEMELEISKITGSGDGDAHLRMVDWAERSQSKCILGQTLSAEAQATGMGSGVADLHGEVRHDILKADARRIAATLTRDLLYPLLALNGRGGNVLRRCPRWVFDLGEAEDLKAYAETLPVLAAHGARISVEWVHTKLRIPIAEEGEALFGQPQAEPIQEADAHARAALKAQPPTTPAPDAIDAIDALIERDAENWQPLIAPLLAPIQRALDDAIANNETAAQFIARLPALLAEMDTTPLTEKLTRAAFIARLAGLANLPMDND